MVLRFNVLVCMAGAFLLVGVVEGIRVVGTGGLTDHLSSREEEWVLITLVCSLMLLAYALPIWVGMKTGRLSFPSYGFMRLFPSIYLMQYVMALLFLGYMMLRIQSAREFGIMLLVMLAVVAVAATVTTLVARMLFRPDKKENADVIDSIFDMNEDPR